MKEKKFYPVSMALILILALPGCRPVKESPTPSEELYATFHSISPVDTLAVRLDPVAGETSREISAQLFLAALDSTLIGKMIYEPDTFDLQGRAYWKVPLDNQFDACLMGINQIWFKFKYLLIYAKESKTFVDILPAAYLYGGDGGQIMSESRIFVLEKLPTIVTRFQEHHLRWSGSDPDEPESIDLNSVSLKQWSHGAFREIPVRDSSWWIRRYPLTWDL